MILKLIALILNIYLILYEKYWTIIYENNFLQVIGNYILIIPIIIIIIILSIILFRNSSLVSTLSNVITGIYDTNSYRNKLERNMLSRNDKFNNNKILSSNE